MKPYLGYTLDELDARLRQTEDLGEYDGRAQDPVKVAAADAIKDLRVALASQIEITNTERAAKERAEALLVECNAGVHGTTTKEET